MGALHLASIAANLIGDAPELTVFALFTCAGVRLTPRFGAEIPALAAGAVVFDPAIPLAELCDELLLTFCRWQLPCAPEQDVLELADLLNTRLCPAPIPAQ